MSEVVVVLVVFVEEDFKHVVEEVVLHAGLSDPRARFQIRALVDRNGIGCFNDSLSECYNWLAGTCLVAVLEVPEGALGDLDVPRNEILRDAWLELVEVTFQDDFVLSILK